jgi:phenylalanyl-tRNA synthetase beta chain
MLLHGSDFPRSWKDRLPPPRADVFAVKGVLEAVLRTLRVDWHVEPVQRPYLHPGRAGTVHVGSEQVGFVGELHPRAAAAWDLADDPVAVAVVDLDGVVGHAVAVPAHRDLTSFPVLRQDLAVVVGDDVPAARVAELVRRAGGDVLAKAEVFDVFRGPQLGEGRVSLALHLEFRAPDRTLTDEDVAPAVDRVVSALRDELGGELRA